MKIKLALLDKDANYLNRISSVFTNKFSDKLEIYSFTDIDVAMQGLRDSKINVFIASDAYDIDMSLLPKHCGFAYFVESTNIETYKDYLAICKFQKVEMIYKIILDIFSDNVSNSIGLKLDSESNVRIITFVSASGGVGASTSAVACAKSFALRGQKTLYLNLEQFGLVEPFFSGEGQTDFGDVIFALKSKKTNLGLKLESNVRQDASGVFFYSSPKTALDMAELNTEEVARLINDLKLVGSYEYIIFDIDFSFNTKAMEIFKQSSTIVFVSDGSQISNAKFLRAYQTLEILDERFDTTFLSKSILFYNKFSNKTGNTLDDSIRTIGGAPKYELATTEQVVSQLVTLGVFQRI